MQRIRESSETGFKRQAFAETQTHTNRLEVRIKLTTLIHFSSSVNRQDLLNMNTNTERIQQQRVENAMECKSAVFLMVCRYR